MSEVVLDLQPVRRFLCGLALCFLAALLAVEAKAAWAAIGGGAPTDLSAVKLCPAAGKRVDVALAPAPHPPIKSVDSVVASADAQTHLFAVWTSHRELSSTGSDRMADDFLSSPSRFQRPPPALSLNL